MFVGVVVENFHRCRIEQEREERAVRAIKKARKNEEKRKSKPKGKTIIFLFSSLEVTISFLELLEKPYWVDYKPFRLQIHKLVTSKYFDLAISAVIGLNVITMSMEFYMMPQVRKLIICSK